MTAAMAKANARVCAGSDRCFALPHLLRDARARRAPRRGGAKWAESSARARESFDVWLEVSTGLVKLIVQEQTSSRRG